MYTFNSLAYTSEQGLVADIIIFAKAYDTVSNRKLLIKLKNYGIGKQLIRGMENFLIGRTGAVIVNGALSTHCNVLFGMPQDLVLKIWSAVSLQMTPSYIILKKISKYYKDIWTRVHGQGGGSYHLINAQCCQ